MGLISQGKITPQAAKQPASCSHVSPHAPPLSEYFQQLYQTVIPSLFLLHCSLPRPHNPCEGFFVVGRAGEGFELHKATQRVN